MLCCGWANNSRFGGGKSIDAVDNEFDMPAWLWACDHGRAACLQPLIDAGTY
jgi:hypothetical protein